MNATQAYTSGYLAATDPDRSHPMTIFAIWFTFLETIFFGLFVTSRLKSGTAKAMDTYLMFPAFVFCFSLVVMSFRMCSATLTLMSSVE
jgi:hypothetical protein